MSLKPSPDGRLRWGYNAILNQPGFHATAAVAASVSVSDRTGRAPFTSCNFSISDCGHSIAPKLENLPIILEAVSQLKREFIARTAALLTQDGWDVEWSGTIDNRWCVEDSNVVYAYCYATGIGVAAGITIYDSWDDSIGIELSTSNPAGASNALRKLNKMERALKGFIRHEKEAEKYVASKTPVRRQTRQRRPFLNPEPGTADPVRGFVGRPIFTNSFDTALNSIGMLYNT
jgi:hypothetical protein